MKKIVLTGGGSAGHVSPNQALIPHLLKSGWEVHYIGTKDGIERRLIEPIKNVTYHWVRSGKFRRYFDLKNITDPFRVIAGCFEASRLIKKIKPNIVFSKGGFVAVPVVYGAWIHKVPVVTHESDITPGLANKIINPVARAVCTTFPETAEMIGEKGICTGTPIRASLFSGSRPRGQLTFGLKPDKPVLMMMGGSLGAVAVNNVLRQSLDKLLEKFQVLHICGGGNIDESLNDIEGYKQYEYLSTELADAFAVTDCMISRAGSNALSEIIALRKPAVLIPYPASASRGDQILNAASLEKRGLAYVLPQQDLTPETLYDSVCDTYDNRMKYIQAMQREPASDGTQKVLAQIRRYAKPYK